MPEPKIGARILAAALALVGTPFRLHGRDAATGVDCVGLVLLSLGATGGAAPAVPPYRLRAGERPVVEPWMRDAGLQPATGHQSGDILLLRVGPLQPHLAIEATEGIVHAHAAIGRVVHMPMPLEWTMISRWRVAACASHGKD